MKRLFCNVLLCSGLIFSCYAHNYRSIIGIALGFTNSGTEKIMNHLAQSADMIIRSQSGREHRIVIGTDGNFLLGVISSSIVYPHTKCYLTAGMDINPEEFLKEIEFLKEKNIPIADHVFISSKAHVVFPFYKTLDSEMEKRYKEITDIGAKKGTGSLSAYKRLRLSIRVGDLYNKDQFERLLKDIISFTNDLMKLFGTEVPLCTKKCIDLSITKKNNFSKETTRSFEECFASCAIEPIDFDTLFKQYLSYAERLKPFIKDDVEIHINNALKEGKKVIIGGSNGVFNDLLMGPYPYVAPFTTTTAGICASAGIGPSRIAHVLGIVPAYLSRVGDGPLPTEFKDPSFLKKIVIAQEKSCLNVVKKARYGWVDLVLLRQAILINGVDSLVISKLDELSDFDEIYICYDYKIKDTSYDYFPNDSSLYKKIEPVYLPPLKGWKTSITHAKKFTDLPSEARAYIKKIEMLTGVPVGFVSVGPGQDQIIMIKDLLPW